MYISKNFQHNSGKITFQNGGKLWTKTANGKEMVPLNGPNDEYNHHDKEMVPLNEPNDEYNHHDKKIVPLNGPNDEYNHHDNYMDKKATKSKKYIESVWLYIATGLIVSVHIFFV